MKPLKLKAICLLLIFFALLLFLNCDKGDENSEKVDSGEGVLSNLDNLDSGSLDGSLIEEDNFFLKIRVKGSPENDTIQLFINLNDVVKLESFSMNLEFNPNLTTLLDVYQNSKVLDSEGYFLALKKEIGQASFSVVKSDFFMNQDFPMPDDFSEIINLKFLFEGTVDSFLDNYINFAKCTINEQELTQLIVITDDYTEEKLLVINTNPVDLDLEEKSSEARLLDLSSSSGTWKEDFNIDFREVFLTLEAEEDKIAIIGKPMDEKAFIQLLYQNQHYNNGDFLSVDFGLSLINLEVLAEDLSTKEIYTLMLFRPFSGEARLDNLEVSSGTLDQDFTSDNQNYSLLGLTSDTEFIRIRPSLSDPQADFKIFSQEKVFLENENLPLEFGFNIFQIRVTAQNQETIEIYTLTAERPLSSDADLINLNFKESLPFQILPGFSSEITEYDLKFSIDNKRIKLEGELQDEKVQDIKINNTSVSKGNIEGKIWFHWLEDLSENDQLIQIEITAQDGATKKNYNFNLNCFKITLSDLTFSQDVFWASTINSNNYEYDFYCYNNSKDGQPVFTTIKPTFAYQGFMNQVTLSMIEPYNVYSVLDSENPLSGNIMLEAGINKFSLMVESDYCQNLIIYNLNIFVLTPESLELNYLGFSEGSLNRPFDPSVLQNYLLTVESNIDKVEMIYESPAELKVEINEVILNSTSGTYLLENLVAGYNFFKITTRAPGDMASKEYQFIIYRQESSVACLKNLSFSNGYLEEEFSPHDYGDYLLSLDSAVSSLELSLVPENNQASISIEAKEGSSLQINAIPATGPYNFKLDNLSLGDNLIKVIIISGNGLNQREYSFNLSRELTLDSLSFQQGILEPDFRSSVREYDLYLEGSFSELDISYSFSDSNTSGISDIRHRYYYEKYSSIVSFGISKRDYSVFHRISLNDNLYDFQDTISLSINKLDNSRSYYYINIIREIDTRLLDLSFSEGSLDPVFQADIFEYKLSLSTDIESLTFSPIFSSPNKVFYNNSFLVSRESVVIEPQYGKNLYYLRVENQLKGESKVYKVKVERGFYLKASDNKPNLYFGGDLSFANNHLAIGTYFQEKAYNPLAGQVYLFYMDNNFWEENIILKQFGYDSFGSKVDLDGDNLVVGAFKEKTVFVYKQDRYGVWGQSPEQTISQDVSNFGKNLVLNQNYLAISSFGEDFSRGGASVYLYVNSGDSWEYRNRVNYSWTSNFFGQGLEITENLLIIGDPNTINQGNNGEVNGGVFIYDLATLSLLIYLRPSSNSVDSVKGENFGKEIVASGEIIAVSADAKNNGAGAVYIFNGLEPQAETIISNPEPDFPGFGSKIALKSNTLLVTGYNSEGHKVVYVYNKNDVSWEQVKTLTTFASGSLGYSSFGQALEISDQNIFVGDYSESVKAAGVNVNYNLYDDYYVNAGAVFIYDR